MDSRPVTEMNHPASDPFMKSLSVAKPKDQIAAAIDEALSINPTAMVVFAAPSLFRDPEARQVMETRLSGHCVIGASTAGEIANDGVHKDCISILSMNFDSVRAKTAVCEIAASELSFAVGLELGDTLSAPDLKAIFLLGPGTNINGSALTEGVIASVGANVFIAGGLAADEMAFKETFQIDGGAIYTNHAIALGLYGNDLVISSGSEGGWRPFGPARKVTRVDSQALLELDGKPALRLYKQYLGEKARELPASGLSYPFAVLRQDRTTSGVIRSALSIDAEREAIILAGEIKEGSLVCLMHADTDALTQGVAQAAAEALRTHAGGEENGCAIVVSCVGRKYVYGFDVDEEVETVVDSFLPDTPISGFYSYGEIFFNASKAMTEFRNQTITITYITERKAGG